MSVQDYSAVEDFLFARPMVSRARMSSPFDFRRRATQELRRQNASVSALPEQRFEYKYLLRRDQFAAVEALIASHCKRDVHAGPTGDYLIHSLYFDSDDMRLYRSILGGAPERLKIRARSYPDADSGVFLEVKARRGEVVRKTRSQIRLSDWPQVLRSPANHNHDPKAARFLRYVQLDHLRPQVLVSYRRKAWTGLNESYARVTIDTDLRCSGVQKPRLKLRKGKMKSVEHLLRTSQGEPAGVLELKFCGSRPAWMRNIEKELGLTRRSFSKFRHCLQSVYSL